MDTEIINIGDELLIGQVINTNASFISKKLNAIGANIKYITTIGDDEKIIQQSLDIALKRADCVIITGGLGPTKDDMTKHTLNKIFGGKLIENKEVTKHVKHFFEVRNLLFTETNHSQSFVPDCCQIIFNFIGTAPGMVFEKDNKLIFSLPGVPYEMQNMMEEVCKIILQHYSIETIIHKTLVVSGIAESFLSDKLEEFEKNIYSINKNSNTHYSLAYLPNAGLIKLRISAKGGDKDNAKKQVDDFANKLRNILEDKIIGQDEDNLACVIGRLLKEKNLTLSTAESCTGGNIAHEITLVSGASEYFKGSVVSYCNEIKNKVLQVNEKDLKTYGTVSETIAKQMAINACKNMNTDYAIATTGLAGPNGDGTNIPIGTVYIAVANKKGDVRVEKSCFLTSRANFIDRTTNQALFLLLKLLQ